MFLCSDELFVVQNGSDCRKSLRPPALGERCHRGLARSSIAVCWRAVLMMSKGQRPHPRRPCRGRVYLQDAADDGAIGKHVEVVVVPLTGWARGRGAFEDQVVLVHLATNVLACVDRQGCNLIVLVIISAPACRETRSEAPLSWPAATALDV